MNNKIINALICLSVFFIGKIYAGNPTDSLKKIYAGNPAESLKKLKELCREHGLQSEDYSKILASIKSNFHPDQDKSFTDRIGLNVGPHRKTNPFTSDEIGVIKNLDYQYTTHRFFDLCQQNIKEMCGERELDAPQFEDSSREFDLSEAVGMFAKIGIIIPDTIKYNREKTFSQQLLEASRDSSTTIIPGMSDEHNTVFEEMIALFQRKLDSNIPLVREDFAQFTERFPEPVTELLRQRIIRRYIDTKYMIQRVNAEIDKQLEILFSDGEIYSIFAQIFRQRPEINFQDGLCDMGRLDHSFYMSVLYLVFLNFDGLFDNTYFKEFVLFAHRDIFPNLEDDMRTLFVEKTRMDTNLLDSQIDKAIKYLINDQIMPIVFKDLRVHILCAIAEAMGLKIDQTSFARESNFDTYKASEYLRFIGLEGCPQTLTYDANKTLLHHIHEKIAAQGIEQSS